MNKLNLNDYFVKLDEWTSKYTGYIGELIRLNSSNASEVEFEELENKYGIYSDIYDAPYYTDVTGEFIQKLEERGECSENDKILLKEFNEHKNKKFLDRYSNQEFILIGLISTLEDYYWIGQSKAGKNYFFSCVGDLNFV